MGRIVVTEFISLDGVIEAPGGGEGYKHDGWTFEFDRGDEGNTFKFDEVTEAEAQLLGRHTYDGFAAAWPSREGEFADLFNSMPKYVVSTTLESADWNNTRILRSLDDVAKTKEELDGIMLVAGSAQLVQGLLEHDLVDELRLMVFPVVLGTGKRLWGETSDKKQFELAETKTVGEGIAILTFRR
jgi:dihydrofolate reductase